MATGVSREEAEMTSWYRITAPHFVAAIRIVDGECRDGAPIVRWMVGKKEAWIRNYAKGKRWTIEEFPERR